MSKSSFFGVINKLTQILNSNTEIYIITTKEGRFTQQLLKEAGVELPPDRIIGKESKQPKHQTLRQVMEKHNVQPIDVWFVEDRLKTLESVEKQDDLSGIGLYLASWGYNTPKAQASVQEKPNIKLLSLAQFVDDFSNWGNS